MPKAKKDIIGRCGYICSRCLAYREHIKSEADKRRFRDGLLEYYRHPLAVEICYCDGCLADDRENPVLLTADCRIRPCAAKKGLENCAFCERYPCRALEKKFIDGKKVVAKYGRPIPKRDYDRFVAPYESRKTLDALRKKRNGAARGAK